MHKKSRYISEVMRYLRPNSVIAYTTTIRKYEAFHGVSFDELIEEALNEQTARVPEHELKVYDRIMNFQDWLMEKYVYNTVKQDITRVKTIYKRCRVRLPYFPPVQSKQCKHNPPIQYHEVLTKEEIRKALDYFKPNLKARIMIMATGGYSLEETATMTVGQFLDDLRPYHQEDNPVEAMKVLAGKDNIIWCTLMKRVKTSKIYYGMCNPETTQAIAKSWSRKKEINPDDKLFPHQKTWVTKHMGEINDLLGFGTSGGFRRFTPHRLRRYNANYLKGNDLTYEEEMLVREIDELQGRALTDVQSRYIQTNPIKQKLIYAKYMNNVSLYNQYEYELFDGDVVVHRIDPTKTINNLSAENKKLKNEVQNQRRADNELKKYIETIGKDNFENRLSKLLQEL